jgi:hypothetical protein
MADNTDTGDEILKNLTSAQSENFSDKNNTAKETDPVGPNQISDEHFSGRIP